ncbi:MAG: SMI1/KNR4 family protein [Capsulimonas sp.]|uniref:SMI1/KNR4 family protein n=1 Tax=Capsulimonas sp. TaxID=2494211 RepID=UPI003267D37E
MTDISNAWDRIDTWLSTGAPEILAGMAPGASQAEINTAEQEMGIQFPDDVRESYRFRNGQQYDHNYSSIGGSLIDSFDLLSIRRVVNEWRVWKDLRDASVFDGIESDPDDGVKRDWWSAGWIPLASNANGDHYCLDLDPAPCGAAGQIITMWHDAPEREVVARSFSEWLTQHARELEGGMQLYSHEYGGIVRIEDV